MQIDALAIGTKVFITHIGRTTVEMPCPDCWGELKWIVSIPCPRCRGDDRYRPRRWEYALEIREATITGVNVRQRRDDRAHEVTHTHLYYDTSPYHGSVSPEEVFTTREAAELFGRRVLDEYVKKEDQQHRKDRERTEKRAGMGVMDMLQHVADEKRRDLDGKIDALREKMLEAIRHPGLDGPQLKRAYTSGPYELTSEALGEWLNALLQEAGLDGWSEEELREATCGC